MTDLSREKCAAAYGECGSAGTAFPEHGRGGVAGPPVRRHTGVIAAVARGLSRPLFSDAASAVLLVVVVVVIAAGTILPQHAPFERYAAVLGAGPATAFVALGLDSLYRSWLFLLPAALLAANMFARARRPRLSLPALVAVLGTALVLLGSLYSAAARLEGILPISVGESRDTVYAQEGVYRLPFSVSLDDFSIRGKAGAIEDFTSTFRLIAGETPLGRGTASVNRPFRLGGYAFYQQTFDPRRPDWTGLLVVRDPGVKFVYPGLALLNAGIVVVLVRCARRRRKAA